LLDTTLALEFKFKCKNRVQQKIISSQISSPFPEQISL
jgi:hypothetical protein